MWKILLSKSHFDKMRESIGGKCDWQRRTIWINDKYIHTERKDIMHFGKIKDVFSLNSEQRFIMILNHEIFHAVYHERVINFFACISFPISVFSLLDIFIFHYLVPPLIFWILFVVSFPLFYMLEEKLAYKHGENYIFIDKNIFALYHNKMKRKRSYRFFIA